MQIPSVECKCYLCSRSGVTVSECFMEHTVVFGVGVLHENISLYIHIYLPIIALLLAVTTCHPDKDLQSCYNVIKVIILPCIWSKCNELDICRKTFSKASIILSSFRAFCCKKQGLLPSDEARCCCCTELFLLLFVLRATVIEIGWLQSNYC